MLDVTYSPLLVTASVLIAVMAAFTALRLTNGLRALAPAARRPVVAKAAVALGGGIWSMHFVGMLAVKLPVTVRYEALPTLLSALFAILVVGIGFIILHFGTRDWRRIVAAGVCTGFGIVGMHYLGMSAVSGNCVATYDATGIAIATAIGLAAATFGLWLAYARRTLAMTVVGSVALGLAICAMHYAAMVTTVFVPVAHVEVVPEPALSTGTLAMVVSITAFVICGLFLLLAIPVESRAATGPAAATDRQDEGIDDATGDGDAARDGPRASASVVYSRAFDRDVERPAAPRESVTEPPAAASIRVPYERDGAVRFVAASTIAAVRADGHYTTLVTGDGELFCPWSISRLARAVAGTAFIRTHRSYLANLDHVTGFRRDRDRGVCLIGERAEIPVSRNRVPDVRAALAIDEREASLPRDPSD